MNRIVVRMNRYIQMFLENGHVVQTDTKMWIRGQTITLWLSMKVHYFCFFKTELISKMRLGGGHWWGGGGGFRGALYGFIVCSDTHAPLGGTVALCCTASSLTFLSPVCRPIPRPLSKPKAWARLPRLPLLLPLPAGRRMLFSSYRRTCRSRSVQRAGGCALFPPHLTPDNASLSQPPPSRAASSRPKPHPLMRLLQSAFRWAALLFMCQLCQVF